MTYINVTAADNRVELDETKSIGSSMRSIVAAKSARARRDKGTGAQLRGFLRSRLLRDPPQLEGERDALQRGARR